LIKNGHAQVAKTLYVAPSQLVEETTIVEPLLAEAITDAFEVANKEQCPTRADFKVLLFKAGLASFHRAAAAQQAQREQPLIELPTPGQVVKLS
jgi:hypothetical protein